MIELPGTSSTHLPAGVRIHINDRVRDGEPTEHKFLYSDARVKLGLSSRPAFTTPTWNSAG